METIKLKDARDILNGISKKYILVGTYERGYEHGPNTQVVFQEKEDKLKDNHFYAFYRELPDNTVNTLQSLCVGIYNLEDSEDDVPVELVKRVIKTEFEPVEKDDENSEPKSEGIKQSNNVRKILENYKLGEATADYELDLSGLFGRFPKEDKRCLKALGFSVHRLSDISFDCFYIEKD